MTMKSVQLRLEPELRERLQAQADADMRPLAGLIRKILHEATRPSPNTGAHAA